MPSIISLNVSLKKEAHLLRRCLQVRPFANQWRLGDARFEATKFALKNA